MKFDEIGTIVSIVSLILAFIFWYLASRQAKEASETLNEIKDKIMSWQNDLNKANIRLIEARPEIIAEKTSLEREKSSSEFITSIANTIEKLTNEADEKSTPHKIAIIKELLDHQKNLVLESEQIKADVITGKQASQSGQEPK